jgi:hypothetical protein
MIYLSLSYLLFSSLTTLIIMFKDVHSRHYSSVLIHAYAQDWHNVPLIDVQEKLSVVLYFRQTQTIQKWQE